MVVLNKNESCDNVKMCKIKMSIKQPSFSYYALCHVLIKGDETKLSKRKSRQNLKHKYIVVRCVKKMGGSPWGASSPELFKSELDRACQSMCVPQIQSGTAT